MELRSGRRLSSQSLPRRCCPDGGGEDRISALPDDMLLQNLVRLRCARAAALTSSLSRRWRGLWRYLSELSFRDIPVDALDEALRQIFCPTLSRLEIEIPRKHRINDPARVSALLHAAARLAPVHLVIDVCGDWSTEEIWCARSLDIRTEESAYVLVLSINFARKEFVLHYPLESDLFQRIVPLPEFSVLETHLGSNGHVFGAMMLDLLGTFSTILKLKVIMQDSTRTQACPPDCRCDESPNWRSQTIPLMSLEEIEIDGFEGTRHEVDFLKLLFRCATLLKRMTVRLRGEVFLPSDRGYKEMLSIFEANPSVQFHVYRSLE